MRISAHHLFLSRRLPGGRSAPLPQVAKDGINVVRSSSVSSSKQALTSSIEAPSPSLNLGLGLRKGGTERTLLPLAPIQKDELALTWRPASKWGLTLDLTSRAPNEIFPQEEVTAGVTYQVTPRFRFGGGVVKGDSLAQSLSSPGTNFANNKDGAEASVRIESAFAGRTAALSPPMTSSLPSGGCSARGACPPMPRICSRCRMPVGILAGEMQPEALGVRAADDHPGADPGKGGQRHHHRPGPVVRRPLQGELLHRAEGPLRPGGEKHPLQRAYVISLYDAGKEIRLRQNPNYHSEQPAELYGINITLGSTDTHGCLHRGGQLLYPGAPGVGGLTPGRCHHRVCRYHLCPGGEHQPQPAGK